MDQSLLYKSPSILIVIILIVVMCLFYLMGLKAKERKNKKVVDESDEGMGAIEGALLGLLALLLSFTFSLASSRHDTRFKVMVDEANTIGTALLRTDMFPDSERVVMLSLFNKYVNARIALYDAGNNTEKYQEAAAQTDVNSAAIWKMAIKAAKSADITERNRGSMMVASLNDMIDAVTTRKAAMMATIPHSIIYLLFLLCFASAFIVGYSSKKRPDMIIATSFALMIGITIFSILDLDRPHRGLIKLDKAEQNFIELKATFK